MGRTQAARLTKYIEFHGGVRLPRVYPPARSLHWHITESAASGWLPQAGAAHGEEATAAGENSNRIRALKHLSPILFLPRLPERRGGSQELGGEVCEKMSCFSVTRNSPGLHSLNLSSASRGNLHLPRVFDLAVHATTISMHRLFIDNCNSSLHALTVSCHEVGPQKIQCQPPFCQLSLPNEFVRRHRLWRERGAEGQRDTDFGPRTGAVQVPWAQDAEGALLV